MGNAAACELPPSPPFLESRGLCSSQAQGLVLQDGPLLGCLGELLPAVPSVKSWGVASPCPLFGSGDEGRPWRPSKPPSLRTFILESFFLARSPVAAIVAKYWMTLLVFTVFPAPDSPLSEPRKETKEAGPVSVHRPQRCHLSHIRHTPTTRRGRGPRELAWMGRHPPEASHTFLPVPRPSASQTSLSVLPHEQIRASGISPSAFGAKSHNCETTTMKL